VPYAFVVYFLSSSDVDVDNVTNKYPVLAAPPDILNEPAYDIVHIPMGTDNWNATPPKTR
jgi:hypothetical protein